MSTVTPTTSRFYLTIPLILNPRDLNFFPAHLFPIIEKVYSFQTERRTRQFLLWRIY